MMRTLRKLRYAIMQEATPELLRDLGATVGDDVTIARGAHIDEGFAWLITIEDHAIIGPAVQVIAHDAGIKRATGYTRIAPVRIGTRAYVGANAVILPGVTIGADAVVGAGAVVTHDVPAGMVAIGVPARVVENRAQLAERHAAAIDDATHADAIGWTFADRMNGGSAAILARICARGSAYVD